MFAFKLFRFVFLITLSKSKNEEKGNYVSVESYIKEYFPNN